MFRKCLAAVVLGTTLCFVSGCMCVPGFSWIGRWRCPPCCTECSHSVPVNASPASEGPILPPGETAPPPDAAGMPLLPPPRTVPPQAAATPWNP